MYFLVACGFIGVLASEWVDWTLGLGPCVALYRGRGRALGNGMRVSPASFRAF